MKDATRPKTQQKDEEYIVNKIREMREMRMTTPQLSVPISSQISPQFGEHSSGYAY
jgi:hypothetical protein